MKKNVFSVKPKAIFGVKAKTAKNFNVAQLSNDYEGSPEVQEVTSKNTMSFQAPVY